MSEEWKCVIVHSDSKEPIRYDHGEFQITHVNVAKKLPESHIQFLIDNGINVEILDDSECE